MLYEEKAKLAVEAEQAKRQNVDVKIKKKKNQKSKLFSLKLLEIENSSFSKVFELCW